jgi:hypothetical protein
VSLANLKRAARAAGVSWGNPTFQTDFLLSHGGSGLVGKLNHASSPGEAARIFMEQWERPGVPALSEREAGARYAFSHLRGGIPEAGVATTAPAATVTTSGVPGGIQGDLMHIGLVLVLVVGGVALLLFGGVRLFKGQTA